MGFLIYIVFVIYLAISIGLGKAIADRLEEGGSSEGVVIAVFFVVAIATFWVLFTFVNPIISNMLFTPK